MAQIASSTPGRWKGKPISHDRAWSTSSKGGFARLQIDESCFRLYYASQLGADRNLRIWVFRVILNLAYQNKYRKVGFSEVFLGFSSFPVNGVLRNFGVQEVNMPISRLFRQLVGYVCFDAKLKPGRQGWTLPSSEPASVTDAFARTDSPATSVTWTKLRRLDGGA